MEIQKIDAEPDMGEENNQSLIAAEKFKRAGELIKLLAKIGMGIISIYVSYLIIKLCLTLL